MIHSILMEKHRILFYEKKKIVPLLHSKSLFTCAFIILIKSLPDGTLWGRSRLWNQDLHLLKSFNPGLDENGSVIRVLTSIPLALPAFKLSAFFTIKDASSSPAGTALEKYIPPCKRD